jgi:hypothetical protein
MMRPTGIAVLLQAQKVRSRIVSTSLRNTKDALTVQCKRNSLQDAIVNKCRCFGGSVGVRCELVERRMQYLTYYCTVGNR